jgi:ribonuclease R
MNIDKNKIEKMCKHISSIEIEANKAQRDSVKYKQAEFMMDKIGNVYDGIITSVKDWGVYVELISNKCEGMIRYQDICDQWRIDEESYSIFDNYGNRIRLGDTVSVLVDRVDLYKKRINFRLFL